MNAPLAGFLALVGAAYLGRRRRGSHLGSTDTEHLDSARSALSYAENLIPQIENAPGCQERERLLSLAKSSYIEGRSHLESVNNTDPKVEERVGPLSVALRELRSSFRVECLTGSARPAQERGETEGERLMKFFSTPGWRPR